MCNYEIDEIQEPILICNRWRTPDGTILESKHRHHFVEHTDANGKYYGVDGGTWYLRLLGDVVDDCENLCVHSHSPHGEIREAFTWGSYGKNGDEPLHYLKLSEMTNEHIQAILDTQTEIRDHVKGILEMELKWRYVPDE
jgi:hypothetical protein